jgi:hypothetical protein
MASLDSVIATKQAAALTKGPNVGSHGVESAAKLRVLDDSVALPVATIATATDRVRFGMIPAGSKIIPHLTLLTTTHTAAVAGKIYLTPIDGSAASTGIACIANIEATEVACMLDNAAAPATTKPCWVDWIPDADLAIASTAKAARLRLIYAQAY